MKIKISDIPKHENASVFLAIAEDNLSTSIKGGENSGRKLDHTSVVRELKSVGLVTAQQNCLEIETTVQMQPDWKKENLKFVVFVQENGTRRFWALTESIFVNLIENSTDFTSENHILKNSRANFHQFRF